MKISFHRSALALVACVICSSGAFAQPATPAPPPDAPVDATVSGRVVRWLPNPNGDVDGLLLDDGTQVAFAPTLSARLLDAVKLKDRVQVLGRRGGNAKVVRATQIKSVASSETFAVERADVDGPPARPPVPAARDALTAMSASGRIANLLYTDRGDTNGVLLDSGTAVRFPPHVGAELAAGLKVGSGLYARGYGTRGGQGVSFEATRIGPDEASARDVFPAPAPTGRAPARPQPSLAGPGPDSARSTQ